MWTLSCNLTVHELQKPSFDELNCKNMSYLSRNKQLKYS